MTHIKSAQKEMRASGRRRERNKSTRSQCKTAITKAEKSIFSGELEQGREAVANAISTLDKAAEKGIIHPNNAGRRKARLMKKLNQALASAKPAPAPEETGKTE
ncbi:30S ribosomal protein S20 [Chloroflexota bacterium]